VQATTSYLVYFSWTIPFNSLFIAPNISNAASHVPVVDIVRVGGLLTIPLVFLSLLGFLKILGFQFFAGKTQALFWTTGLANAIAIVLCTQVWPSYHILMMIGGALISLAGLYVYGRLAKVRAAGKSQDTSPARPLYSTSGLFKAYAPLLLGVVIVLLTRARSVSEWLDQFQFGIAAWGYNRISINIFTAAGFYIFLKKSEETPSEPPS